MKFTLCLLALAIAAVAGDNSNYAANGFIVAPHGNNAFIVSIANSVAQANHGNAYSSATSNANYNVVQGRKLLGDNSNEAYNSFVVAPYGNNAFIVSIANSVAQANHGNAYSAATSNANGNVVQGRKLLGDNSNYAYNGFVVAPHGNNAFIVSIANSVAQANHGNAYSSATSNANNNVVQGRKLLGDNSNEAYNSFIVAPHGNNAFIVSIANSVAQANYGDAYSSATSNANNNVVQGRKLLGDNSNYAANEFIVAPYGNAAFIVSIANSVAQANHGNAYSAATSNANNNVVQGK